MDLELEGLGEEVERGSMAEPEEGGGEETEAEGEDGESEDGLSLVTADLLYSKQCQRRQAEVS